MKTKTLVLLPALLTIMLALGFPTPGHAREGFWLGGGLLYTTVQSELDGIGIFCSEYSCTQAPVVIPGELKDGTGISFSMGYGFNANVALEYLTTNTGHKATHAALGPGVEQTANLTTHLIGTRIMAPLSDSWELFGRVGLALFSLRYPNSTVEDWNGPLQKSEFKGNGYGYGTGFEYFFNSLSLEISLTQHIGRLINLETTPLSSGIDPQKIWVSSIGFALNYHFN